MPSVNLDRAAIAFQRYIAPLYDEADRLAGRSELLAAVAFARGVAGVMLPNPDAAEPSHAIALLRFAVRIEEAEHAAV